MSAKPEIRGFFDDQTNTITYLVWDPAARQAAVIDPVLDYDPADGTVDTRSAEKRTRVPSGLPLKEELSWTDYFPIGSASVF